MRDTKGLSFSLLSLPCFRFPIPDSRFPIPDSRFPIPRSAVPCSLKPKICTSQN
ncbi:hypothetical protein [Moorena sp. SIO4G3]|uniref:hypothetical protein n=1 Tax=Moorena sp. SIO4G3 TaxID=2607821 RepID=UPI00142CD857|nr:hypothetical protein [Moorena sp. SIO4G3]NEO80263.1 hypothetical protein [Moorena sp. SIO4G3]